MIPRVRPYRVSNMFKFCFFTIAALAGCSLSVSQAQRVHDPHVARAFRYRTSKTGSSAGAIQFGEFLGRRAAYLPSGLLTVKGANLSRRRRGSRCGKQARRPVYRNCLQDGIRSKFGNDLPEAERFGHHRSDAVYPATERGRHLAIAQYEPRENQRMSHKTSGFI